MTKIPLLRAAVTDLFVGLASSAILYFAGAVLFRVLTIPWDSQHPPGNLFFLLSGIALCLTGGLAVIRLAVGRRRMPISITLRLGLVVTCVGAYEGILVATVVPRISREFTWSDYVARHPVLFLALEVALPAGVAAVAWWLLLRPTRLRRLAGLLCTAFVAAIAVLLIFGPGVARGAFEAAGWLRPLSPRHFSGAYTPWERRYVAYLVGIPLAGLPFAVYWLSRRRTSEG
jgi:hypothetical protein